MESSDLQAFESTFPRLSRLADETEGEENEHAFTGSSAQEGFVH